MRIDGKTRLVGVVGDPVAQIRTPQLLNAAAALQDLNVACIPMHVRPVQLMVMLSGAAMLENLLGLVVTIPFKQSVIAACAELTDTARTVGAINAMRLDHDRRAWIGGNFDGQGFICGLRDRGHTLAGKRVLVLGAGGAATALAYAIARERPDELSIHNRTGARADELATGIRSLFPLLSVRSGPADPKGFDVVVNGTSLGLRAGDALPVPLARLDAGTLVCEAVIRDGDTALLAGARQRGCAVHHGQFMLGGQILELARFLGVELKPHSVARAVAAQQPKPDGSREIP